MSHYEDEAQVEALKKWWQENWKALAAGLVLGLGAIFGWEAWQNRQTATAGEASRLYEELSAAVTAGKGENAIALADQLVKGHGRTPYAAQAQLALARYYADKGEWEPARERLAWVKDHASDEGLQKLARLRLARVLWQLGKADEALALLDQVEAGTFAPLFEELRGDIKLTQGDRAGARAAYEKARDLGPPDAGRDLLERKLDDLADVAAAS